MTDRQRDEIHSDDSLEAFGTKLDIPLPKNSQKHQHKKHAKIYAKSLKIVLNILWICLEDSSYEHLQEHERLLIQLSIYLSTELCQATSSKETVFVSQIN